MENIKNKLLVITVLILDLLFSSDLIFAQNENYIMKTAQLDRYASLNEADARQKRIADVVFIGNSITEGWAKSHPIFFSANNFIGRGIGGQVASQMLLRFQYDVINLKPIAVVINGGINDIAENVGRYNEDFTFCAIKSMAEIAKVNGIKVILTSVLPASAFKWRPEITDAVQKIDSLNQLLEEYAHDNLFAYIDYNGKMRDKEGGLPLNYSIDGVHPTKEGYELMEKIALPIIKSILK